MKKATNIPYRIDSGVLIEKGKPFINNGENRQSRRSKTAPFIGNGKNYPLTVVDQMAYVRSIQITPDGKRILHYLPKNNKKSA